MRFGDPAQPGGSQVKRFVPADTLPARVGVTLRPRALQGIEQPVRMVDELRRRPPLGAQRLAGWVRRVRFESDETAVLNHRDRTTTRDTQSAVTSYPLAGLPVC